MSARGPRVVADGHRSAARRVGALAAILAAAVLLGGCGGGAAKREAGGTPGTSPADLYVELSAEYLRRGQLNSALAHAERALREDRKSARAHYMMAIVQQRLGRTPEAEQSFAEAARIQPDNPVFRNAWGYVLCTQGRYDEALREIEQAANDPLYETPEIALMNAADCARRANRPAQVDTYLRAAVNRNPRFGPALLALARRDYDRGSYQEARALMTQYGQFGAGTPEALLLAAQIERRLGNAQAAQALETALKQRYPNAPETMQL